MALKILCVFDPEFEPNGMDPLGALTISDGTSRIAIEVTYLDSWLKAIIESLARLRPSSEISIEVPEEKTPLHVKVCL